MSDPSWGSQTSRLAERRRVSAPPCLTEVGPLRPQTTTTATMSPVDASLGLHRDGGRCESWPSPRVHVDGVLREVRDAIIVEKTESDSFGDDDDNATRGNCEESRSVLPALDPTLPSDNRRLSKILRTNLKERMCRLNAHRQQKQTERDAQRDARRKFNALSQGEANAIQAAFDELDSERTGWVGELDVVACLRELGLHGTNKIERREIKRISEEAANLSTQDLCDDAAHVRVDFLTFALTIVPQVRRVLTEMNEQDLLRKFNVFVTDGSGKLPVDKCWAIARTVGVDRWLLWKLIEERGEIEHVDFEEWQSLVSKAREQSDRTVRQQEREIKESTCISDALFEKFRHDIVHLFDLFTRHKNCDSDTITESALVYVLADFGLRPCTTSERSDVRDIFDVVDVEEPFGALKFEELLNFTGLVRAVRQEKKQAEQLHCFERYDKDGNDRLSMDEVSNLLCDIGCVPRSRAEQDQLGLIMRSCDAEGKGFLVFEEFQVLSQRIDEKMQSMAYDDEMERAAALGFDENEIRDMRLAFDVIDGDGSGTLDSDELISAVALITKGVTRELFESTFATLDSDGNGGLDFFEFLQFMQLMRDREGIFAGGTNKLAKHVKFWETWVLRRTLEHFGASKQYLASLSKDKLAELFCVMFSICPDDDIHEALKIQTVGQLFEAAKARAR